MHDPDARAGTSLALHRLPPTRSRSPLAVVVAVAAMNPEDLAEALVPIAAELAGTVRDYGPDDVAAVLARVPDGRYDALAVVLAAMVDPDARPSSLLAWSTQGPTRTRERFQPQHLQVRHLPRENLGRIPERRAAVARMTAAGRSAQEISERLGITKRAVQRHRMMLRAAGAVDAELSA